MVSRLKLKIFVFSRRCTFIFYEACNLAPRLYFFFMLNSVEHEIFPAYVCLMPTSVGILTLMSRKNSILSLSEPENADFHDIFISISI